MHLLGVSMNTKKFGLCIMALIIIVLTIPTITTTRTTVAQNMTNGNMTAQSSNSQAEVEALFAQSRLYYLKLQSEISVSNAASIKLTINPRYLSKPTIYDLSDKMDYVTNISIWFSGNHRIFNISLITVPGNSYTNVTSRMVISYLRFYRGTRAS